MKKSTFAQHCSMLLIACVLNIPSLSHALDLQLPPKDSKIFENNYGITVHAVCKIQCAKSDKIQVRIINNQGAINGKNLSNGESTSLVIHNQDAIQVAAEPGTKVSLTNLSNEKIQASCSL